MYIHISIYIYASSNSSATPTPAPQLKLAGEWRAHGSAVWALAFGGGCVFSGSHDGGVRQWDPARGWLCVRSVQVRIKYAVECVLLLYRMCSLTVVGCVSGLCRCVCV